jgi:hypothetical protein
LKSARVLLVMRICVETVWPSTTTLRLAAPRVAPAVNRAVALPLEVGNEAGTIAPSVAENPTSVPFGTAPPPDVSASDELKVRSAVIGDEPPRRTLVLAAPAFSTRYGLVVAAPATPFAVTAHPAPPAPGPKLHPHQLFSAVTAAWWL